MAATCSFFPLRLGLAAYVSLAIQAAVACYTSTPRATSAHECGAAECHDPFTADHHVLHAPTASARLAEAPLAARLSPTAMRRS
jgi:hypothetical protein